MLPYEIFLWRCVTMFGEWVVTEREISVAFWSLLVPLWGSNVTAHVYRRARHITRLWISRSSTLLKFKSNTPPFNSRLNKQRRRQPRTTIMPRHESCKAHNMCCRNPSFTWILFKTHLRSMKSWHLIYSLWIDLWIVLVCRVVVLFSPQQWRRKLCWWYCFDK